MGCQWSRVKTASTAHKDRSAPTLGELVRGKARKGIRFQDLADRLHGSAIGLHQLSPLRDRICRLNQGCDGGKADCRSDGNDAHPRDASLHLACSRCFLWNPVWNR